MRLGETTRAVEAIRDGNRLRVADITAIGYAVAFHDAGDHAEASRLFDLAEPLDLLTSSDDRRRVDESRELLSAWAEAAPLFRPLPELLDRIASLTVGRSHSTSDDAERVAANRAGLVRQVGNRLLRDRRWHDLDAVIARLSPEVPAEAGALFMLLLDAVYAAHTADEAARSNDLVERLQSTFPVVRLDRYQRVFVTELLLSFGRPDEALAALGEVTTLELPDFSWMHRRVGFSTFDHLYRQALVLAWLDPMRFGAALVPPPLDRDPEEVGLTHFMADVIQVARFDAAGLRGDSLHASQIGGRVLGIMRRFDIPHDQTHRWFRWGACRSARAGLYEHLVTSVARHGPEALEHLRGEFVTAWTKYESWPWVPTLRRDVAVMFYEADPAGYIAWACEMADHAEATITCDADAYGAASDLNRQSEVWVQLQRPDRAKGLYARAVEVTARTGYKDHQIADWMRVFDRFAWHDPTTAATDINWLANGLYGVRESADGEALHMAAGQLVQVAFRLDPAHGVNLFARFRDHGLLSHADGVAALVRGAIDHPAPPVRAATYCLADLAVPFDYTTDVELGSVLVRTAYGQSGTAEAAWVRDYLLRRVATFGYPCSRSEWWTAMEEATSRLKLPTCPRPQRPLERRPERYSTPTDPDPGPDVLIGDNGPVCTLADAQAAAKDLPRLMDWAAAENFRSRFDWPALFERLVNAHPLPTLRPLVRGVRSSKHSLGRWLIDRGRHALASGDRVRAADFARLALATTDNLDWYSRHSSTNRMEACRLLINAAGAAGREEFWRAVAEQPCREPIAVLEMTQMVGAEDVTREWELAADRLRVVLNLTAALPTTPDAIPCMPGATAEAALSAVLVHHCTHPTYPVCHAARRACGEAILEGNSGVEEAVRSVLHEKDSRSQLVAEVLAAVGDASPTALAPFASDIPQLAASADACVAAIGRRLASLRSIALCAFEPVRLPGDYFVSRIMLPAPAFRPPREVNPSGPLPDADGPVERLGTTIHILSRAAQQAAISDANVMNRAAAVIGGIAGDFEQSSAGEVALRARLDNADLKLTFVRLRSRLATRATAIVVSELHRGGRLTDEQATAHADELRSTDPGLSLLSPVPRPPVILPLDRLEWDSQTIRKWVHSTDGPSSLPIRLSDGRYVLAEHTRLRYLHRTQRDEDRRSVSVGDARPRESMGSVDDWCPCAYYWRSDTYSTLQIPSFPGGTDRAPGCEAVIIRHGDRAFDSHAAGWLAFNPTLAARLGWQHDPAGLFRWVDSAGQAMVESVWWHDGPVWDWGGSSDQSVSRGWLVVAVPRAVEQIESELRTLRRYASVRRSARLDDNECPEDVAATDSLLRAT